MTRIVIALLICIAGFMLAGLAHGDVALSYGEIATVLLQPSKAAPHVQMIIYDLRMPRLLLSILVGGALAVAGVVAQAIMRNPLAEPGILGINSGAALAIMIVIVGLDNVPAHLTPWAGFLGASVMAATIYGLSWRNGSSSLRIILIGIGLSSMAGAMTTTLSTFGEIMDVQRALIWLAGSVYHADWAGVRTLALWLVAPLALTIVSARMLDLIQLGDPVAKGLGQRVNLVRALMIVLCTLISGAAVAAAGLIGFIGLVAPHLARRLVGPMHRKLLPVSALIGALLVLCADIVGRTVMVPAQLPAGLVVALIGAPFFGFLLWRHRHVTA